MPITPAQKRWMSANTTKITIRLTNNTDKDILSWLDKQASKQGAIRAVLKAHIAAEKAAQDAAGRPED